MSSSPPPPPRPPVKRHAESTVDDQMCQTDKDYKLDNVIRGEKRSRRIYISTSFEDSATISELQDSNDTDSMSKSTIEVSEPYSSPESSCDSNCDCDKSDSDFMMEYDVRSSSSTCEYMDSNLSSSSTSLDYQVEKINTMCEKVLSSDHGYLPDDSDAQLMNQTIPKTNLPFPARFKTCVQCRKPNANPYFQYCHKCFRFRMEFFEKKPNLKRKRTKHTGEKNVPSKCSQESSSSTFSEKKNFNSKDIETSKAEVDENSNDLCNICLSKPKNGVFNHGKIGHVYCCYTCAKLLWKKSNKCPLCNAKIKFVTKMITG